MKHIKRKITIEELEKRIKNYQKQNVSSVGWILLLYTLFFLFFSLTIILKKLFLLIPFALILLILLIFYTKSEKRKKMRTYALKAINFLRSNNPVSAFDYLMKAYKIDENNILFGILQDIELSYDLLPEQHAEMNEILFERTKKNRKKDEKLYEILTQIAKISDFIKKHRNTIDKSWQKINELQEKLKYIADTRLQAEYQQLISRYKAIIELENSKINFYAKALDELLILKENHIHTQNLLAEKRELETLENSVLEKSYKEAYETDLSVDDFLLYEKTYLEALKEYAEELSSANDEHLFDEIIEKFKIKTELL